MIATNVTTATAMSSTATAALTARTRRCATLKPTTARPSFRQQQQQQQHQQQRQRVTVGGSIIRCSSNSNGTNSSSHNNNRRRGNGVVCFAKASNYTTTSVGSKGRKRRVIKPLNGDPSPAVDEDDDEEEGDNGADCPSDGCSIVNASPDVEHETKRGRGQTSNRPLNPAVKP